MYDPIRDFPKTLEKKHRECCHSVPSKTGAVAFLDDMIALLFPETHGLQFSPDEVEYRWKDLQLQFAKLINPVLPEGAVRREIIGKFFMQIPPLCAGLDGDAEMYNRCDPASHSKAEVILSYPGFFAVMVHRFAHVIYMLDVPILPRILSEHAHSVTGIDIHPGARIGRDFYIDHGTGIVIGETSVIGDNVKIYQGVTLGATFVEKGLQGKKRHPTIEDNVIIYAGATVLGGETVVGHDTVIGGNVWLTESVPACSKVYHKPEIFISDACEDIK